MKSLKVFALLCILVIAATSCSTSRRTLAQRCAQAYPCTDDTIVTPRLVHDTIMLAGYDDTVTVSVPCPPGLTDTLRVPVVQVITTPAKLIPFKYTVRDTFVVRLDSALAVSNKELEAANAEMNKRIGIYEAQLNEARRSGRGSWWPWVLVGLLSAAIVYLVFLKKK